MRIDFIVLFYRLDVFILLLSLLPLLICLIKESPDIFPFDLQQFIELIPAGVPKK